MSDTKVDTIWFTSGKGTVGIVKVDHADGTTLYYISAVEGGRLEDDICTIVEWGAKLPKEAGDALFGVKSCVMYEDKVLYGDKKSLDFVSDLIKQSQMNTPRRSAQIDP